MTCLSSFWHFDCGPAKMIRLGRLVSREARRSVPVHQDTKRDDDRYDAPLSERNRADAYAGMLDSSVYQFFVLPVEVAMVVCVQVAWWCEQASGRGLEYVKLHGQRSRPQSCWRLYAAPERGETHVHGWSEHRICPIVENSTSLSGSNFLRKQP